MMYRFIMFIFFLIVLWCLYFPYNLDGSRRVQMIPVGPDKINDRELYYGMKRMSTEIELWIESGDTIIYKSRIANQDKYDQLWGKVGEKRWIRWLEERDRKSFRR